MNENVNFMIDQENLKNFNDAGQHVLKYLRRHFGFKLWMITRTEGNDWIVLQTEDHGYHVKPGQVFNWADSFCSQMILDKAPRMAPNSQDVPLYAQAKINQSFNIKSYIGQPLLKEDGSLFGTLCAIDPSPQPKEIEKEESLVHLLSQLLSQILQNELKVNEQKRISEKFKVDSLTDPLTGLFNRRAWDELLALEEDRCKTYGHPTTVIIIDLNNLKKINDTLGHMEGDKFIQRTANILKDCIRSNDIVARLGGDEFAILNIETNLKDTKKLSNRITKNLNDAGITAAIGIALRNPSKDLQQSVKEADQHMYEHKMRLKGLTQD